MVDFDFPASALVQACAKSSNYQVQEIARERLTFVFPGLNVPLEIIWSTEVILFLLIGGIGGEIFLGSEGVASFCEGVAFDCTWGEELRSTLGSFKT